MDKSIINMPKADSTESASPRAHAGVKIPDVVPPEYVAVRFIGSKGKLSAPSVLHFKNYLFEDAIKLSQATEDNIDDVFIEVLNNLVFEDFDCGLLHREEVKEILLKIYGTWWNRTLDIYYYAVDIDKPMEKENRSIASIPISAIDVKELPDSFAEPINILSPGGKKISFILPRMINSRIASQKISEMFDEEESKYQDIRWILEQNENLTPEKRMRYDPKLAEEWRNFRIRKLNMNLKILQALQILSVNDEVLPDLDSKLEVLKTESMDFFSMYNQELKTKLRFGIEPEVKFTCTITSKEIVRKFPFRCVDLVPSMEQVGNSGYSVSFG